MQQAFSPSALGGMRVLELPGLAGQYCGKILADLGADVIKVEPPEGDPVRRLAPFKGNSSGLENSLVFLNFNANKRSVVLDLGQPGDRDRYLGIVRSADAVVESFAPGALDRWDVGYQVLSREHPGIVLTSVTPFGQTGPFRDFQGNDMVAQALGGLQYISGDSQQPPAAAPFYQAYQLAGLHAAFGTLVALQEVRRNGCGQHVDVSVQDVMAHLFFLVARYGVQRDIIMRQGARSSVAPNTFYPNKDGHVCVSPFAGPLWQLLAEWIDEPLLLDPLWNDIRTRQEHADLIDASVGAFTARFTTREFVEESQRRKVPSAPVYTTADFIDDKHVKERGFFIDQEHPVVGAFRYPGPYLRMAQSPLTIRRPAPLLGQHTAEVLVEPPRAATEGGERTAVAAGARLPLEGIRVVDFTRNWAGPLGTRALADFGAEVIKIESALVAEGRDYEGGSSYADLNRNKRSITLDLRNPEAQRLVKGLVATADLVVENFGPGVMQRLGLDYEKLRAVKSDLVFISMPGMGTTGPYNYFVTYGPQLAAYCGLAPLWGHAESPVAARTKLAFPDYVGGAYCNVAAIAALQFRQRTGLGQYVEIPQLEATAAMMGVAYLDYFVNGRVAQPEGNRNPNFAPHDVYPCQGADRWVAVGCESDSQWQALCAAIGRPELAADAGLATVEGRKRHGDEIDGAIAEWTRGQTPHQAMYPLQQAGVPAGVVANSEDLYHDVHLRGRGFIARYTKADGQPSDFPGLTVRLSHTPGAIRCGAPALGEANAAVLGGILGVDAVRLQQLIEQKIVV
ncbi:MAG: CoA transferase [Chloroflexota bacterium]